ncbi:MAG: TIGR01906 family membrane protein [Chloroflexi bacterium]|nr:TIGR01906 family membrane protein [Chloroflexota bacterium]
MKIIGTATKWLFALCLPVFLLTASIGWWVNSLWFYEYGFQKFNVSQTTGLPASELARAARGLITYFNSGEEPINVTVAKDGRPFELFNEREVTHLKDVKGLFRLDYLVFLVTFAYCAGYTAVSFRRGERSRLGLAQAAVWGSGLALALMLAFSVGSLLNFDQLFYQFHLLSFANEFWMLDPTKDYLIMLFPQGFWYSAALAIALSAALGALVLGGLALWYLRRSARRGAGD